jgi:predicted ferric reductase
VASLIGEPAESGYESGAGGRRSRPRPSPLLSGPGASGAGMRGTGPQVGARTGPQVGVRTGPQHAARTGPQVGARTGPQVSARTGPQVSARTGPQPAAPTDGPTPSRVKPRVVLGVIFAGAIAVIVLWWKDAGQIQGLGGYMTAAGDLLGLLSGYSVIILVALMARIPPLERGIGGDRLARWHAMGGRYTIGLISGHVVTIVWGYTASAKTNVVSETKTMLTTLPDVLMATVAWILLLGIALVSARAVRRRMRYETWYYLHFYTYLAVALAFSHQFAVGPSFVSSLATRFWWAAMYVLVAALVVWFRIVTPIYSFVRHDFRVAGVRQEGQGVISIYIGGKHLNELSAQAGQFFRWRFLTRGLWWQSHPYSLSAAPGNEVMRITVKALGDHSRSLADLQPGTRIFAEGPYGALTAESASTSGRGSVLIAGGVGITPLRALLATLPGRITLVYRASKPRDVVFRNELEAIARDRGVAVHYLIGSRAELGGDPLNPRTLTGLVPGLHRQDVYVCGPPGMTDAAVDAVAEAGVPKRRIHHESFEF